MRLITCQRWHSPQKGKGNYCLFNVAVYHMDWDSIVCPKCKAEIPNPNQKEDEDYHSIIDPILQKASEITGIPDGRLAKLANICTPTKNPNRKWGEL